MCPFEGRDGRPKTDDSGREPRARGSRGQLLRLREPVEEEREGKAQEKVDRVVVLVLEELQLPRRRTPVVHRLTRTRVGDGGEGW